MYMKRIYFLLSLVLLAVAAGGWYAYREYHRTHEDISTLASVATLEAAVLIRSFEKDTAAFHQKYTDQVLSVTGVVKQIDAAENPVVIALEGGGLSSVQCSMDSTHAVLYRSVKAGATVTVKGLCTGARTDDLFGSDVILSRCVLSTN